MRSGEQRCGQAGATARPEQRGHSDLFCFEGWNETPREMMGLVGAAELGSRGFSFSGDGTSL